MIYEILSKNLFDFSKTIAHSLLEKYEYPWEIIGEIKNYIIDFGSTLSGEEYIKEKDDIWISKEAVISPTSYICGPAIIQRGAEIRHCAYIRGSVIIGEHAVVGNSTEIKNSILFNNTQVPHYNYIGDSILGYKVHMGAGAITSNIKSDKTEVKIKTKDKVIQTGLRKLGAIVGDCTEIGCNAVLNPGTILGKNCSVYPLTMVRGHINDNYIMKNNGDLVKKFDTL